MTYPLNADYIQHRHHAQPGIAAARRAAIEAFSGAVIAYFGCSPKDYVEISRQDQVEVAP